MLSHAHKLASDWEKPELVSLAISIIFGGKFIYKNLELHTPRIHELSVLNSQIKNSQNGNLEGNVCWQSDIFIAHTLLKTRKGTKIFVKRMMTVCDNFYPIIVRLGI